MRNLLRANPDLLGETNYASQTPFHLAADAESTMALGVLIEAPLGLSTQFDTPDAHGKHALDVLMCSGRHCFERQSSDHADCARSNYVDKLQSAGWQLSPRAVFLPRHLLSKSCHAMRIRLMSTIIQAREELRATACTYLSAYERQRFQLDSPQILDACAYDVVEKLIKSNFNFPQGYDLLCQTWRFYSGATVYHDLCNGGDDESANVAELFYCSGFTDFDREDGNGKTPLQILTEANNLPKHSALFLWFVQHDADVSRDLGGQSTYLLPVRGLKVAHRILRFGELEMSQKFNILKMAQIIRIIAPLQFNDECSCGCVEAGCTTTTVLFNSLWKTFFKCKMRYLFDASVEKTSQMNSGDYQTGLRSCAYWLSGFLRALQIDFAQWSHVSSGALRFFTFKTLNLTHTCHCGTFFGMGFPRRNYSEEVIKEMQEEDHDLLHLLDGLVEEFVEELESSGDTFERFLTGYWVDRMEEIMEVLEAAQMSPEQLRAAEEIGVIWDDDFVSECEDQRSSSPTLSERFGRLIGEIDEIVAEST